MTAVRSTRTGRADCRRRPDFGRARTRAAWLLLAPAILLTVGLLIIPMGYALFLSLRGSRVSGGGLGRRTEVFVGLDNYLAALTNPELWAGVQRLIIFGLISVPITLGLALLFALLLDHPGIRGGKISRILIFLPFAVPGIIASLNWGFIYLPGVSPIQQAFEAVGLPAPDFFADGAIFGSLANIAIWGGVGFNMIILYTSLRSVPAEIYDAARIDGCNETQIALRIKVPMIIPGLVLTGLFSLIGTLQLFSEPTTLAKITNTISTTWVPMMTVYRDAFILNDVHTATATAVLVTGATVIISLLLLRALQGRAFREES